MEGSSDMTGTLLWWVPGTQGCQSQGDSLEEAIGNIKEAIELYLEALP